MLNAVIHGAPSAQPPLLIAHGLFGSARNWGVIAARLGADRQVIAVDMRNHGESPWYPTHSYPDMAADLAQMLEPYGQADVLGHSMGGKAAMMLALTRPALVRRLVLADIAPVAYGHSQQHYIDAMLSLPIHDIATRSEADGLMRVSVPEPGVRAFLLQSLDLRAEPSRWRLNLSVLQAEMTRIVGWPDVDNRFAGPALFLSGALSQYVLPEHRGAVKRLFPGARFAKIPDAGHWLHAESPRAFERSVAAFLG